MSVSMIAAIGKNNELGKGNDLIWHFRDDMKFFRTTTTGSTVIMGRKTFDSLPGALPNRRNIVITRNADFHADNVEVVSSVDEALRISSDDNVFVIGGGKIYEEFLKYADKLYLTEIEADCDDAEIYFPEFDKAKWKKELIQSYEDSGVKFSHVLYTRV